MAAPSYYSYYTPSGLTTMAGAPYEWDDPGAYSKSQAAQSSSNPYEIVAPERTTLDEAYQTVLNTGLLPSYSPVNYTPLSYNNQLSYTPIQGYDQSYWDSLYDSAKQRKEKEYFSDDSSLQNQLKTVMSQRGLVGSGIEAGSFEDLYSDFGEQLGTLESDLSRQRMEADLDLSKFNTQNLLDVDRFNIQNLFDTDKFNTQNLLDTEFKNKDLQNFLSQLGLSAAGDEARTASEFDTSMFENEVNLEKVKADQLNSTLEQLTQLFNNTNTDPQDRENILSQIFSYANTQGFNLGSTTSADNNNYQQTSTGTTPGSQQWYVDGKGWTKDWYTFQSGSYKGIPKVEYNG